MSTVTERESPRRRCRKLVKRGKAPAQALLVPIVHSVAAQIEGLEVQEFLSDATLMAKCLTALQQSLETDAIVCFVDPGSTAESVGAQLDWRSYPPEILALSKQLPLENISALLRSHPRIQTGVEVLKRLGATITDGSLFAALITGPATLAAQIGKEGDSAVLEQCSQIVGETCRIFGESGVHMILIKEKGFPQTYGQQWQAALIPVINVARFYDALPVLIPTGMTDEQLQQLLDVAPENILMCTEQASVDNKSAGQILIGRPDEWTLPAKPVSLVTTADEISPDTDIPELRAACQRIREELSVKGEKWSRC